MAGSMIIPREFMPLHIHDEVFMIQVERGNNGSGMHPLISPRDYLICVRTQDVKEGDAAIIQKGKKKYACKYYRKLGRRVFYENAKKEVFDHKGYKLVGKVSGVYKNLENYKHEN